MHAHYFFRLVKQSRTLQSSHATCTNFGRGIPAVTLLVISSRLTVSSRPSNPLNAFLSAPLIRLLLTTVRVYKIILTYLLLMLPAKLLKGVRRSTVGALSPRRVRVVQKCGRDTIDLCTNR